MPDLLGSSLQSLLLRVDELEMAVEGHTNHHDARPSVAGVWSGEDFSI
jgi:serine O-acetyltransferase